MRKIIRKSLEDKSCNHILEAVDGKDALDVLMEHKIDLIISDLYMPKVNGIELLKALRSHSVFKEILFIVLVADVSENTFREAMKYGITDYIKIPFTREELAIKIEPLLESYQDS